MNIDWSALPTFNNHPGTDIGGLCPGGSSGQKQYFEHLGVQSYSPATYHTVNGYNGAKFDIFVFATDMAWEVRTPYAAYQTCGTGTPVAPPDISFTRDTFNEAPWVDAFNAADCSESQIPLYPDNTYEYNYGSGTHVVYQDDTVATETLGSITFTINGSTAPEVITDISVACGVSVAPPPVTETPYTYEIALSTGIIAFVAISWYIRDILRSLISRND